jgi:hypothetical protein
MRTVPPRFTPDPNQEQSPPASPREFPPVSSESSLASDSRDRVEQEVGGAGVGRDHSQLLTPDEERRINQSLAPYYRSIMEEQRLAMEDRRLADERLRLIESQIVFMGDSSRPTHYDFVIGMLREVSVATNLFGYRNALFSYLILNVVPIIAVTIDCLNRYPDANPNGIVTSKDIEILNSYNKNRTEMRHGCFEEKLPYVVPAAFIISALGLLAFKKYSDFTARRSGQETEAQTEVQTGASGNQQAPGILVTDIVMVEEGGRNNSGQGGGGPR